MKEGCDMKKILAIILLVGLLVATPGCGLLNKARDFKKGLDGISDVIDDLKDLDDDLEDLDEDLDEKIGDDGDDVEDSSDDPIFSGEVFHPEDWTEVMNMFKEFGYVWVSVDENGVSSEWSIYYKDLGSEEVDGVTAQVVSVTKVEGGTDTFKFWFDEEWECLRAEANGEDTGTWDAGVLSMLVQLYTNTVLLTTGVLDEDGTLDTSAFSLEDSRRESADVGSLEVYEISSKFTNFIYTYGLSEVNGQKIFATIKNSIKGSKASEEMRLTHANPR
jgi:hypothetical protein